MKRCERQEGPRRSVPLQQQSTQTRSAYSSHRWSPSLVKWYVLGSIPAGGIRTNGHGAVRLGGRDTIAHAKDCCEHFVHRGDTLEVERLLLFQQTVQSETQNILETTSQFMNQIDMLGDQVNCSGGRRLGLDAEKIPRVKTVRVPHILIQLFRAQCEIQLESACVDRLVSVAGVVSGCHMQR